MFLDDNGNRDWKTVSILLMILLFVLSSGVMMQYFTITRARKNERDCKDDSLKTLKTILTNRYPPPF